MNRSIIVIVGIAACSLASTAQARTKYLIAWLEKYPTSTLPSRMTAATGSGCNICHHPTLRTNMGTCYRMDIIEQFDLGMTIAQALDLLDTVDSDGDGTTNGKEILMVRDDDPAQIGYHPGLVGPTGTDPCASDTAEIVTNVSETPPPGMPATSTWGLIAVTLMILTAGAIALRSQISVRDMRLYKS